MYLFFSDRIDIAASCVASQKEHVVYCEVGNCYMVVSIINSIPSKDIEVANLKQAAGKNEKCIAYKMKFAQ